MSESANNGKGGSMARFAISGDILYTVSTDSLKLFNIEESCTFSGTYGMRGSG
jgi:hypothetical protein